MSAELDTKARARLIERLLAGDSKAAAAREAGYSRQHLYRLLDDPTFKVELEARRRELAIMAPEAVAETPTENEASRSLEVLARIRDDSRAEDRDRIAAAKAILTHAKKPLSRPIETPPVLKVLSDAESKARDQARTQEELAAWRKTLPS